ncbi:MAG: hypothetical protein IPJ37_01390 [Bacteroidales bacterium]|nr:hypothetical protein [Bacteroidales bacterium]
MGEKVGDKEGRTREPSPMAAFHDGRFFLSANPTLTSPLHIMVRPNLKYYSLKIREKLKSEKLFPVWSGNPPFTEHSYRSFAADGKAGELILLQNIEYTHAEWSFLDSKENGQHRESLSGLMVQIMRSRSPFGSVIRM